MNVTKLIIAAIAGAGVSFAILTIVAQKKDKNASQVGSKTLTALKTKEGLAMVLTPEGRNFVRTPEFKDLMKTLTREKASAILQAIKQ